MANKMWLIFFEAIILVTLLSRTQAISNPFAHIGMVPSPSLKLMGGSIHTEQIGGQVQEEGKASTRDFIQLVSDAKKTPKEEEGSSDPWFPYLPDRGYIDIYGEDNSMWYWHFRAKYNPETAPLILWFEGGPGAASTGSVFTTNGPFLMDHWPKGSSKVLLRNITWIENANIVYPDFPLGVGFSTVTGGKLSRVVAQVREQILIFFESFLKKYPEYKKRPLYIGGVSYGGHWVPHAATALKYSGNPDINIRGFYISDGLMDAKTMDESYFKFGLKYSNYTKYTQETIEEFTPLLDLCLLSQDQGRNRMWTRNALNLCWFTYYGKLWLWSFHKNNHYNPYYMPGPKNLPPGILDSSYEDFVNYPPVQSLLGVKKHQYQDLNMTFFYDYAPGDLFVDMKPLLSKLVNDGVKGVIIVGELDFLTNYMMSEKIVSELQWKYQTEYNAAERTPCKYGLCKEYENLREVRVAGSGHGVTSYKPEYSFEIINTLIGVKEQ